MAAASLTRVARWSLLAEGRTAWLLRWGLGRAAACAAGMAAGSPWGAWGVAAGFVVASWASVVPILIGLTRITAIGWKDLGAALGRPALAAAAACGVGLSMPFWTHDAQALKLLAPAGAYGLVWIALPGGWTQVRASLAVARDRSGGEAL